MRSTKLDNDKYYTPIDLAKECIDKTFEIIGKENITEIIEPSAGNGSFSNQIANCIAYDLVPESDNIKTADFLGEGILQDNFIAANTLAGTNNMQIFVCGNDERITITSRFDNLGKGASGAAVQCMNIMMGIDEATGL